tara:strand:+ start:351 stop:476 length:126 start_codon:yes stop_codon:yes gene_type:complete
VLFAELKAVGVPEDVGVDELFGDERWYEFHLFLNYNFIFKF